MMVLLYFLLVTQPRALGLGYPRIIQQADTSMPIIQIMNIDDADRKTLREYADNPDNNMTLEEITRATEPTGKLKCPQGEASGNLVGGPDVVVINIHDFINRKTCKTIGEPKNCTFHIGSGKNTQAIQIKFALGDRLKCPPPISEKEDWLVVRLKSDVKKIQPYKLPSNRKSLIADFSDVVLVSAQSHDFVKNGKRPKHVGNCMVRDPEYHPSGVTSYFYMNCDFGLGSSGGAVLRRLPDKSFEIIGIAQGVSMTDKQIEEELKTGKPTEGEYSKLWNTSAIAITEELYDAIVNASGETSN